jgi:hypothetical protein
MIYCLSIVCRTSEYSILLNNKQFDIVFKQHISLERLLKSFVELFLYNFGFANQSKREQAAVLNRSDSQLGDYDQETNAEDLRYTRFSKTIRKPRVFKLKKAVKRVEKLAQEMESKIQLEKPLKLYWEERLFDQNYKLKYSDLNKKKELTVFKAFENKSTQTETILDVKLKENWILQKTEHGTNFYLNSINGFTTYNINEVIESTVTNSHQFKPSFSMDFESGLLLTKNFNPRSKEERQLMGSNEKIKPTESNDKLEINKLILERDVLVKWRDRAEFDNFISDTKENFDQIGSKLIESSIFENLKVNFKIKEYV